MKAIFHVYICSRN